MSHDNAAILKKGFEKAMKMIDDKLFLSLWDSAVAMLKHVGDIHPTQGWKGFTGNTQTSYACGIYMYGRLEGVVTQDNWHEPTRRRKIDEGKWVYLRVPYEGRPRARKGMVPIVDNHGLHLSLDFLENYKAPKKHIALVMTTGTEYSEWLETSMGLDVLTNTYMMSARIIDSQWKKIDS